MFYHEKEHFSMENYENRVWGFRDQSNTQVVEKALQASDLDVVKRKSCYLGIK